MIFFFRLTSLIGFPAPARAGECLKICLDHYPRIPTRFIAIEFEPDQNSSIFQTVPPDHKFTLSIALIKARVRCGT